MGNMKEWALKLVVHDERCAVKQYDSDGKFVKSFIFPTDYRPLPDGQRIICTPANTEPITDEKMLSILATIPVRVGRCYTTARQVYDKLKEAGYDVKTYEGWLVTNWNRAIHHCVCVVDNHYIDFANSEYEERDIFRRIAEKGIAVATNQDVREATVEQVREWQGKSIVERNPELGKIHSGFIFAGAEETPENAIDHFNQLMDKYPDHEDYNGNGISRYGNKLNKMLQDAGLE